MSESRPSPEKVIVTAICVVGFINATQMANWVLSPMSKQIGGLYPLYFSAAVIVSLACLAGLWFFKRWAAWVYAALLVGNQLVLLSMGFWDWHELIVPAILLGLLVRCKDKLV